MVKREVIRIAVIGVVGFLVSLFYAKGEDGASHYGLLLIPLYFIGMFYAGKTLIKLMWMVARTYFSCQFTSLMVNPLWGTIICILLLILGLSVIFHIGWIIGLGKCVYCLVTAYQIDRKCKANSDEW